MRQFIFSLGIAVILTVCSYALGLELGWLDSVNWVEAFAVFTSYSCTLLCSLQTRWNYPIGAVSTAAWSILFWTQGMYALSMFNLYLVFSLAYGYFRWGKDENTRKVTETTFKESSLYGLFGIGVTTLFLVIVGLVGVFDGTGFVTSIKNLSAIDVLLAALSGVAQLLLDNKKLSNWTVWIVVNIISIPYMFSAGLPVTAVQYVFFLGNAFLGYYLWKKSMVPDYEKPFIKKYYQEI